MITKPEEHDIDRAGKRLLRAVVEQLGWVLNDVEEDYGIDSNVQIFDGAHPTGAWFHVQLKSSCHSEYSSDHAFISQELSFDHARHYALNIRQPIVVIHADATAKKVYWYFPQLDRDLVTVLDSTSAKSITIRIPTTQELHQSASDLLLNLEKVYLTLANRELVSASTRSFAESLHHLPNQKELASAFQAKNDVLKLERIRAFFHQQQFDEARSRSEVLIGDPDSTTETKFWAQMQLQAIDHRETIYAGKPQNELPRLVLKHAKRLQQLTKAGPNYLKFYSLIARQAADLEIMAHESFSLFMAFRQHLEAGGNPMMIVGLHARRSALSRRIVAKYNRCVRLARYAASYKDRWALGRALTNIVRPLGTFMVVLRGEGLREYETAFANSALQVCKLSVWISLETGDTEGIVLAIIGILLTVRSEDSEGYRWAVTTANNITDKAVQTDAQQVIERATKRWKGEKLPGDYQGDTLWQAIQNVATGMGFDLTDEKSPVMRELQIAARDDSPERILVNCEHLLAAQGAIGPTALKIRRLLAIDTVGAKVIHCTLHDYHVEERDLDSAYKEFKQLHCDSCPDAKPRSPDWRYDEKARQLERIKFTAFVERFRGKPFGIRYTDQD